MTQEACTPVIGGERKSCQNFFGKASTSSYSSAKTSRIPRTAIRVPQFLSRFSSKNKKNRSVVSKLDPPFTSTPDPSDDEGSVEYEESECSENHNLILDADDAYPFALNTEEAGPLEYDVVRVVSVNVNASSGPDVGISAGTDLPNEEPLQAKEMLSKSSQTLNLGNKEEVITSACNGQAPTVLRNSTETSKVQKSKPSYGLRLCRSLVLILLTLGILVTVSFWSFVVGKVYYTEHQKTKNEPTVVCKVLSYTDSWLSTDFYRKMECEVESDEPPPFLDQVFAEAEVMLQNGYDSACLTSRSTVDRAAMYVDSLWQQTPSAESLAASFQEFLHRLHENMISVATSINDYFGEFVLFDMPQNATDPSEKDAPAGAVEGSK